MLLSQIFKPLFIGLLVTVFLMVILERIGFIRIDPREVVENILILSAWWLFISFTIYNIPYLRKNKRVAHKIIGLLVILVLAIVFDVSMNIPDNPVTVPLIVVFWLGMVYLVLPHFFVKYRFTLLITYVLLISYFLYVRLNTEYSKNDNDTIVFLISVSIIIFAMLWLFEQWKWFRTLKKDKANAELALLKSQINPHFFFNTLNNLYGLTVEKSDKAPKVVLKLSDMMRYTIYEGQKDFVFLGDEIGYLENYIALHKLRYQKTVSITFNHAVDETCRIAPLLFIILLENAFKHGVERLTEYAYIHINLTSEKDTITFQIENNFEYNKVSTVKGIGLGNLKHRLKLTYPNQHQLSFQNDGTVYKVLLKIHKK